MYIHILRQKMDFLKRKTIILSWNGTIRLLWVSDFELKAIIQAIKEGDFNFEKDFVTKLEKKHG